MGRTVLDPGAAAAPDLHLYAHCQRGHPGGVTILAINASRSASQSIELPVESERYTLTAAKLTSANVELNGHELQLGEDDSLPQLVAVPVPSGTLTFAPASITFITVPNANNPSCRLDE